MSGGYLDPKKLAQMAYKAFFPDEIIKIINEVTLEQHRMPDDKDVEQAIAVAHYNDGAVELALALRQRFEEEADDGEAAET